MSTHPYISYQVRAGWSKYKEWPESNWTAVRNALESDISFVGIDERDKRSLAESIAIFANARMHIGIDSFCNHLTNYYWTDEHGGRRVPGVILFGSTQPSASGYPSNTNICHQPPCGPCFRESPHLSRMDRGPCVNPPRATYEDNTPWACMDAITVDEVVEAVRAMWEATKG